MSKKLDDELAEALLATGREGSREDAPGVAKPVAAARPSAPTRKRNLGLLVSLLAMVAAIVALFLGVFQPAAVYATPVDKLLSGGKSFVGRKVRVEGELVPGTLAKRDDPCEYRFFIHKDDARLPVRYAHCSIPDGFRDVPAGGVQVTVEGSLADSGDFQASLVMAKCSSKYDPAKHEMAGSPGATGPLPVN
jgi:cytochrome c-type biogenesis protein CcmE